MARITLPEPSPAPSLAPSPLPSPLPSAAPIEPAAITGLLLAGGRGSRMGGVDKGLLMLHGEPLAQHVLRRLRPQVGEVLISANRNLDAYAALGARVLPDDAALEFAGPLAGIAAGLRACTTPWLLCVPCDAPQLPADLARRLGEAALAGGCDGALAVAGGRRQPVFVLLRRELLPSLLEFLRRDQHKVGAWLQQVGCAQAAFDDEAAFANINLPQQLDELRGAPSSASA